MVKILQNLVKAILTGFQVLCSTTEDLLKWYNTFTAHPEVLGLSHDSLYSLTAATEPTGHLLNGLNASFAQGIGVTVSNNQTDKVRAVQSSSYNTPLQLNVAKTNQPCAQ